MSGTVAGPVVEVELPPDVKEGDLVEATVPPWTAEDVPPPPPAGGRSAAAPPPPPPPDAGWGLPGRRCLPPPPPRTWSCWAAARPRTALARERGWGDGESREGGAPMGTAAFANAPPPPMPPVSALGIERARPPMTLAGGTVVEVPPPPPPPSNR